MKKIDQIDSEVAENTHQMHKNELSIEKLENFIEKQKGEIHDLEEEMEEVEKDTKRNTRILTILIIFLAGLFFMIYVNGKNVYEQTGVHEQQNQVF